MSKEEIKELLSALNIETYNGTTHTCCMRGINGQVTLLQYEKDPLITIKNHLIQMGRDGLKMELNSLLSITGHH